MANPTRTLRPEDEISRYRIVGPLGAGGMGEVYLAQDTALGRNVALKILPPEIVRNEERVRRFVLEARSASSLSHPNIVTIHEIGQDVVKSAGGVDSNPVHFISMELVSGKTLSALIHEENTDLRTLLGYLAQAADGIAKAHAAGIVHRDLKPGNIMVTADGFAKVLDFGLAKLTETRASDPDATSDPTVGQNATGEGTVVGTAGYMSPEQVQGKSVDHRSDVFSFGCILYEAATRRRAFAADSSIETMHKVLHETPAAVEELNPKAPAELRRLVRRCLQKSPEQRLQSMKDLALELRDIESEYESLSASASSGSRAAAALPAHRRAPVLPWVVAGVVVVAAAALAWWGLRQRGEETAAFQKMRMTTQTSSGDVISASLSADGRYLAYLSQRAGLHSLRVRQVATGSDVVIVPPGEPRLANPSFSPDGNYLYYTSPRPDRQNYLGLYQVPSLGGAPREIAFDVDSRVSCAPDGRQLAFRRHSIDPTLDRLVVLDVASRQERVLAEIADPVSMVGAPAWSPDGRQIAAILFDPSAGLRSTIALFDARDGRRQDWARLDQSVVNSLAWGRAGAVLVTAAQDIGTAFFDQVQLRSYPAGRASRLTNDFNSYSELSASQADETIAAVRASRVANLSLADVSGAEARRLTSANSPENSVFSAAAADSANILFVGPRDGILQVWAVSAAGGAPRSLTGNEAHRFNARAAAGVVVFDRLDSTGVHVWTMNADGGAQRQLTRGAGEQVQSLSPDGTFVITVRYDSFRKFQVVSTADGRVLLDMDDVVGSVLISPDSRTIAVGRPERDQQGLTTSRLDLVPLDGGPVKASVRLPDNAAGPRWAPDGRSLTYLDLRDPGRNVHRQSVEGGAPVRVTRVTDGRVLQHRWSPDGERLGILVRSGEKVDLWVTDADGGRPVQVTRITPEVVGNFEWLPDSRRLVVEAATRSSDAVLIRDFR